jgi:DNA-binding beta-propeller fold protein YncE
MNALRLLGPLLAALLLAACASGPQVLRLDISPEDAGSNGRVWPAPQTQEVPRYRYVGQLVGEANFQSAGGQQPSAWRAAWKLITGLTEREPQTLSLQRPQAGVVDAQGRVLVTDVSRGAVFVFDEAGGQLQLWQQASAGQRFVAPIGIAAGRGGRVYVADAELGRVAVLDAQGRPQAEIGAGVLQRPTGLAFDPAQARLFVADTTAHDVKVFDEAGRLIDRWGRPGELNAPTHLAWSQGVLYVADTLNARVLAFDELGQPLRQLGRRGLYIGNLVRPKGVAADDEGNVYVVEGLHDHLLVYDQQAQLLLSIGGTGAEVGKFYLPAGVWLDTRNRVFVADMFNGRVVVFQFLGGG